MKIAETMVIREPTKKKQRRKRGERDLKRAIERRNIGDREKNLENKLIV